MKKPLNTKKYAGQPLPGSFALPGWAKWLLGWAVVLCLAVFLVYYWRVAFMLDASGLTGAQAVQATLAVAGVFSLLYLALFLLCRFTGEKPCLRAAIVVFIAGLLFCFATAPLQAPDEERHYRRAYSVSEGRFTYDFTETYPEDVNLLLERFPGNISHRARYEGGQLAPDRIEDYLLAKDSGTPAGEQAGSPIQFLLLPYLHQGLFMAVARLFGLGALGALYAARIANLAVYAVLCGLAFKNCARYRGVFYAVALMPLSLFMAASCNMDGLMLGLCYCLLSFFCKEEFTTRDAAFFTAALAGATYLKPNNAILALVLLCIPKSRWRCKIKAGWLAAGMALVAVLAYFAVGTGLDGAVLKQNWPDTLPRGSGEDPNVGGQLGFMLRHPVSFVVRTLLTVVEADGYLFDLGRLGGMDLVLPLVGGLSVLVPLVAAALSIRGREDTKKGAGIGLGLTAFIYSAAALAGMYVLDSDYSALRISGAQPRYFLPAFLLLFVLGSILLGQVARPRLKAEANTGGLQNICLWLAAGLAVFTAVLVFQNYYVGMWAYNADGTWKLVNLFGWQTV